MEKIKAVLFDFDLTLADASKAIIRGFREIIPHFSRVPFSDEDVVATIGIPLTEAFMKLTGIKDENIADRFRRDYISFCDSFMAANTRIYEGVPSLFALLKEKGIKIGIISSKLSRRIEETLIKEDIMKYTDIIIGIDCVTSPKPSPEGIEKALCALSVKKENALYIGDHTVDAVAAANAGVMFAAVTQGVCKDEDFLPYEPLTVLDSIGRAESLFI